MIRIVIGFIVGVCGGLWLAEKADVKLSNVNKAIKTGYNKLVGNKPTEEKNDQ
jgi:uncharacterized protein YneF (UPF0154 family)